MPHFVIEYSETTVAEIQVDTMMEAVYGAAVDSGLFEEANIKIRAIPLKHYRLGHESGGFIHAQCRIHEGRNAEQKRQLSEAILNALCEIPLSVRVTTVEVVEMDTASYSKRLCK
jgi:5-carboxymethyl-2-hydroxymuconate isomerase